MGKAFQRFLGLSLVVAMSGVAQAEPSGSRPLSVKTSDGVSLEAVWWGTPTPIATGWVLMHGVDSNRGEWEPLVPGILSREAVVCSVDLRGHARSGGTREWKKMPNDVELIVSAFSRATGIPKNRIGIGGASLGANLALVYAANHPEVPSIVLLSPGMDYAGIEIEEAYRRYGKRRVFMAASPGDPYAFSTVQQLARLRTDPALRVMSGSGAAHGVQMFSPSFNAALLDWMTSAGLSANPSKP